MKRCGLQNGIPMLHLVAAFLINALLLVLGRYVITFTPTVTFPRFKMFITD